MNRLLQAITFGLVLVATGGYSQPTLDSFPQLGTAPDPNDLFLIVDVAPGGNTTKNVKASDVNNHTHLEAAITDLDKYTQAEVDALLGTKAATSHTHTKANITDFSVVASDVDAEASADGYVLTSDGAGNAAWEAVAGGGGPTALNDLTDVTITTPSTDQVLKYDGAGWINAASPGGGGGATSAAAGTKVLIQEIVNDSAGDFNFDNIPSGYDRLIIEGVVRSDATGTDDATRLYFNGDTTDANYFYQRTYGQNGAGGDQEGDFAAAGVSAADGSPSGYVTYINIVIPDYTGADVKQAFIQWAGRYASGEAGVGIASITRDSDTSAITQVQVRTNSHPTDQLTGTLRLYGEKSLTIEDSETITVKKKVATITDPASGEFDFDFSDYQDGDRIIIEGTLRGDVSAVADNVQAYFNADTIAANYYSQDVAGYGGAALMSEQSSPMIAVVPAASSPSGSEATIRMVLEDYAGEGVQSAITQFAALRQSTEIAAGHRATFHKSSTSAITRIRIRTDNHSTDTLTGTLTAYIEKSGVLPMPSTLDLDMPVVQSAYIRASDGAVMWSSEPGWSAVKDAAGQWTVTFPTAAASADEQVVTLAAVGTNSTAYTGIVRSLTATTVIVKAEDMADVQADRDIMITRRLPDTTVVSAGVLQTMGMHPIETITLSTAGEFDFDNIPQGYRRLIIKGSARGDVAAAFDGSRTFLNSDTADANYHFQVIRGSNGATAATEGSAAFTFDMPGASSPAGSEVVVSMEFENYSSSTMRKAIMSTYVAYLDTDNMTTGTIGVNSDVTDPITRIRVRTNNHPADQMTGTLTLYGEY